MKLIITEKPSVGRNIASVVSATKNQNGYIEGNGYIISWCIGHLVDLTTPEGYKEEWEKWSLDTLPMIPDKWKHSVKASTSAVYKVIKELMARDDVTEIICATDAGREGELIFRRVYHKAGCKKPFKRLWVSSQEESAIKEGLASMKDGREYDNLFDSAMCRAKADWLIGLNGTRLFTIVYNTRTLNVGRVISPTLAMIVERQAKINNFRKEQYFMVHILCGGVDAVTERIDSKTEAEKVAGACLNGQALVTSVIKEEKAVTPPKLYDLTTLQRDANRLFGFTAKQTLDYTQSLYENKLVTYPRTDSQFLSDDMAETAENVIKAIFDTMTFVPQVLFNPDIGRILNSKKVSDHHAIIPTVKILSSDLSKLPEAECKILSLVANRLLCATGEKHLYESVKAEFKCQDYIFTTSGKEVVKNGWKDFDEAFRKSFKTTEEKEIEKKKLPELREGVTFDGVQTKVSEHFTSPPKHYTEDTLLSAMENAGNADMSDDVERKGMGTPATRAEVIETLVKNGFVERNNKKFIATEKGINLISVLPGALTSPQLTVEWENRLALIAKGEESADKFMKDIEEMCRSLVLENRNPKDGMENLFPSASEREKLATCPVCGKDIFKGKMGLYCSGKCGLGLMRVFALGQELTEKQILNVLNGKKVLFKGLKNKQGTEYDAYAVPAGVEDYTYKSKEGVDVPAKRLKFSIEFPKRTKKHK